MVIGNDRKRGRADQFLISPAQAFLDVPVHDLDNPTLHPHFDMANKGATVVKHVHTCDSVGTGLWTIDQGHGQLGTCGVHISGENGLWESSLECRDRPDL